MGILLCRPVCLLPIRKLPSFLLVFITKILQNRCIWYGWHLWVSKMRMLALPSAGNLHVLLLGTSCKCTQHYVSWIFISLCTWTTISQLVCNTSRDFLTSQ
jgi:hypothetical protein